VIENEFNSISTNPLNQASPSLDYGNQGLADKLQKLYNSNPDCFQERINRE
jgi:hypothetical protein